MQTKIVVAVNDSIKSLNELIDTIKDLRGEGEKTTKSTNTNSLTSGIEKMNSALKKTVSLAATIYGVKKLFSFASDFASEYIDIIETQNLFATQIRNVTDEYGNLVSASSNYYERAIAFQDELNKKIYTNKAEMMKYQAMYYSMFESQNIGAEDSYFLSENLTKAGIDIASLFNLEIDEAMEKIKSGIAGQVEPLRTIGIDISESSLQTILDDLGIDRSVQELSYAEKEIARYIAIVNQAGEAQGDFAKTFNSPANQIKMLKNQFIELKQVIGGFIMNAFGGIIKYALATIIAIKNVLNAIGKLFGWELSTDTGETNLSTNIGADDLSDDLGTAVGNAKELKKQLMGFDEINNITPNTGSSGSGGSGGSINGIDSALLDALDEWDMKLEGISDEVTALAEKIENKLMKAVDFVREHWDTILEIVKAIGVALLSWKIAKGVTDFLSSLGLINKNNSFGYAFDFMLTITGIYLMYQGLKKLLNGEISFESIIETLAGFGMMTVGICDFLRRKSGYKMSLKEGLQCGFGITLAVSGIMVAYQGLKKILNGEVNAESIIETLVGLGMFTGGIATFLKGKGYTTSLKQGLQYGFNLTLALAGIFGMYNSIKKAVNGNAGIEDLIIGIVSLAGTATGIYKLIKATKTGSSLSFGKTVGLSIGISLTIGVTEAIISGVEKYYDEAVKKLYGDSDTNLGERLYASLYSTGEWLYNDTFIGSGIKFITGNDITQLEEYSNAYASTAAIVEESLNKITAARDATRDALNNINDAYEQNISSIKSSMENSLLELDVNQELANSLGELLDSNAKVKEGYEDRVDYVLGELNNALDTELTRNGDLIYNNGEVVNSYSDLQEEINKTIEARKKEVEQEAYLELYKEAMKEKIASQQELTRNYEKAQEAYQNYMEAEKNGNTELAEQYKSEWYDYNQAVINCAENVQMYTDDMATYSIGAFGEISASAIENGEITNNALQNAVSEMPETWEQSYSQMEGSAKNHMLGMSTNASNFGTEMKDKWKEIATSPEAFIEALNETDGETREIVANTIYGVENLTPDMVQAWSSMAERNSEKYLELMSQLPEDTRENLKDILGEVSEFTPVSMEEWQRLANENSRVYNEKISQLDDDTREELEKIVAELNNGSISTEEASKQMTEKILAAYNSENGIKGIDGITNEHVRSVMTILSSDTTAASAAGLLGSNINSAFTGNLGSGGTAATNFVSGFTGTINSLMNSTTTAVSTMANKIVSVFNKGLGNHSPSRFTKLSAKNFNDGFANMLDDVMPKTVQDVAGYAQDITDNFNDNIKITDVLNEGIKVDENAFKADINEMLDYGDINGQIQTQIELTMNDNIADQIARASYDAFVDAMRNQGVDVNVNIEAKTDEGTVLKKVSDGVEDHIRRTGKMPFPVVVGR